MIERTIDWQTKLLEKVESLSNTAFVWGEMDCVIFAATCVDTMTTTQFAEQVFGKYDSEESCKKFIVKTYGGLREAIGAFLHEEVSVDLAQRGDVVVFTGDNGTTTGVMWSTGVFAMAPNGAELLPIRKSQIMAAWRV